MKIAFIQYYPQAHYSQPGSIDEDYELLLYLTAKGLDVRGERWHDETVYWDQYDVVILKSPWGYHEDIDRFRNWLTHLDQLGIKLLNPAEIVRWNSHKRYLQDMINSGLQVIPSLFIEKEDVGEDDAHSWFDALGSDKLVLKPCISAGAHNTTVLERDSIHHQKDSIHQLLKTASYLVQPFMPEISRGEWSFVFFNQQYSHGVLKIPKEGDFRVQFHHGGNTDYRPAERRHIDMANEYVQSFAKNTLYARVDGIIKNGIFYLMELELIEPYLFLNANKKAFENYHQALLKLL